MGLMKSYLEFRVSSGFREGLGLMFRSRAANDPIAIVEATQVMRVKAVTEVCADFHRPWRGGVGDSARNRAEAVRMLPGGFGALLKFFNTQSRWAKNDVLTV